MFACQPVGLDYLAAAPVRLSVAVGVRRPPGEVFAALAHDPAAWGEFFPGFDTTGRYHTPGPHGVGSLYTKRFLGVTVEERVLAWDDGIRFAFRVERSSAPLFHAWVENYRFQPDGRGGTVLRVTMGARPRLPVAVARVVLPRALSAVFVRVGRNLERGRRFSPSAPR